MKILKNTKEKNNIFPVEIECTDCHSIMEVDKDDYTLGECGFYDVTCPVCGKKLSVEDGYDEHYGKIADMYFENLTKETVNYPDTFYDFSNGVKIDDYKINEWVKCVAETLDDGSKFSIVSSGNTCVFGCKVNNGFEQDDDDIYVLKNTKMSIDEKGNVFIISDNYSNCELIRGDE